MKLKFIAKLKSFSWHSSFFNSGKNRVFLLLTVFALVMTAGILFTYASPWTGPAQTPSGGNVDVPINVGSVDQYKLGGLGIGGAAGQSLQWLKNIGGTLNILNASNNPNLVIGQDGNVGIGTTEPEQRLHVVSPSDQGAIFETFRSEGDGCFASGEGSGCDTEMHFRSARGTPASPEALQDGDEITEWYASAYDGSDWISAALINFDVDGPVTPGHVPGRIEFRTSNDTTRMTIKDNGNVGIGATNPQADLHIAGDGHLILEDTSLMLEFIDETDDDFRFFGNNDGKLVIETNIGSGWNSKVTFQSNGNVGIGATNPSAKLEVASPGDYTSIRIKNLESTPGVWELRSMQNPTNNNGLTIWGGGQGSEADRLVITVDGKVGIGTNAPDQRLSVNGNASKVGGGSWATFSDVRLKNILGTFDAGLTEILKLQPVRYHYNEINPLGINDSDEHVGFNAQEVQKIIPEAVSENTKGYLMLENDPIIWAMLNAIKEQQLEIDDLRAEIKELKDAIKK